MSLPDSGLQVVLEVIQLQVRAVSCAVGLLEVPMQAYVELHAATDFIVIMEVKAMEEARPQTRPCVTYDRMAAHYDSAIRPFERLLLARLREKTLAALHGQGKILEVGAGTGLNFQYYEADARGVASELSREMIRRAEMKSRPRAVSLIQANLEALPFHDAYFDAALATLLFCSVASPQKSFRELRRVVRAGGTIALLEHVRPSGLLGPLFDLLNLFTVPLCEDHFNRRTADEACRAGFEILSLERHALGIFNIIVLKRV